MSNQQMAPETTGVAVKLLATDQPKRWRKAVWKMSLPGNWIIRGDSSGLYVYREV
ncbi:hypothetical protein [Pseudomonas grandcourensis]|uniref:hypothetical protein n=1 Tax=Pseudomonas grandcourensis TaxID=3136736 RepID=UPI003263851F